MRQRAHPSRQRGSLESRVQSAGGISLQGTAASRQQCGSICRRVSAGFWTLGLAVLVFLGFAGVIFLAEIMSAPPQQPMDLQVIAQMLEQIAKSQADQQGQINQLGAAVTASGQVVQGTQQTTEQVVTEVVQQVQQAFQAGNQAHQDQLTQLAQGFSDGTAVSATTDPTDCAGDQRASATGAECVQCDSCSYGFRRSTRCGVTAGLTTTPPTRRWRWSCGVAPSPWNRTTGSSSRWWSRWRSSTSRCNKFPACLQCRVGLH